MKKQMISNSIMQPTFLVHDYETFGIHPAYDRPAQFAAIRTDSDFNIIEEPLVIYCKPANDYLPDPQAVLITGITPQQAISNGINEAEFAHSIHQAFNVPNSCIMGYNNIRFDDEVSRHLFYRNFYDPYAYSWQNNNSRWDLLDVLRTYYALRPDGIVWPLNDEGLPSFKLEDLTKANHIEHLQAHDAMSDVYATIAIAKLAKQAQPKLFDYLFQLRNKRTVMGLIDIASMQPLVHISGMFGACRGNTSLIAPLAWHPTNKNAVIVCDLAGNINSLIDLTTDQLRERLYTRRANLADDEFPVPLKLIHINKCPSLAPEKTLRKKEAERLSIDLQYCLNNLQILRQQPDIREKIVAVYAKSPQFAQAKDVDAQLYDGFFTDADRSSMNIIQQTKSINLPALDLSFSDPRIKSLLFRYQARNFPETLNEHQQRDWLLYRKEKLNHEYLHSYFLKLEELAQYHDADKHKIKLINAIVYYAKELIM